MNSQSTNKIETKRATAKGSKELEELLKRYECPNGFFRVDLVQYRTKLRC